jgi:hypothetical protein
VWFVPNHFRGCVSCGEQFFGKNSSRYFTHIFWSRAPIIDSDETHTSRGQPVAQLFDTLGHAEGCFGISRNHHRNCYARGR